MSIAFSIFFGDEKGDVLFTVEDDGSISVDDDEFESDLALAELGFDPSGVVEVYNVFKEKPFELLWDQGVVKATGFLKVSVEIAKEELSVLAGFIPGNAVEIRSDIELFTKIANRDEQWMHLLRPSSVTSYLDADPYDADAPWGYCSAVHAIWVLRESVKSIDGSTPHWMPMQLQHILAHIGRAKAHEQQPLASPHDIINEREQEIKKLYRRAIRKLGRLVVLDRVDK